MLNWYELAPEIANLHNGAWKTLGKAKMVPRTDDSDFVLGFEIAEGIECTKSGAWDQ